MTIGDRTKDKSMQFKSTNYNYKLRAEFKWQTEKLDELKAYQRKRNAFLTMLNSETNCHLNLPDFTGTE